MAQDTIRLTVPARGEYAKAVRMTAAALVSRMGMTYDEVDDVRMAAEEAFVFAVESLPEGADVSYVFILGEESIQMTVSLGDGAAVSDEENERRASYAEFILQSVCDGYELGSDETGMRFLRLTKRARSGDVA